MVEATLGAAATGAGYLLRVLVVLLSWIPPVAGPLLVLYGTYQYSPSAAYILAGVAISTLTFRSSTPRGARHR